MKPTTVVTDAAGRVVIEGVTGAYSVASEGKTATVDASTPGSHEASVTLA